MRHHELRSWIDRYQNASFTVMKIINNEIRARLRDDLTIEQHSILRYIRERAYVTSTELADMFLVSKSTITSIIAKLADKELLVRVPDPGDRRVIRLEITEAGRTISLETDHYIEQWLAAYLKHFHPDEVESFIASFEKLAGLVSNQTEGRDLR